ncbi:unnamed protein product [Medioppia subpectinata]|uniref:ABC transmembrane type-1 domain-containing protein n=1 Tax=Medioppia subpectinata TaxID=1979941 RepID=A0A7R9L2U4_9ACAR|nr:unnamed protein product [Medioppia subpectinata]CAG2114537.1 unnamed protein product [Medioppia subpectinata]
MVGWLWSLFFRAHKKDLEFSDLYRCPKSDETHRVRQKLEMKAIAILGTIRIDAVVNLFQPYCIVYLIRYFNNDPDTSQWWAIWAAVGIVLTAIANTVIYYLNVALLCNVGVKVRAACCALIYRKSMRLSHSSLGQTTVGQILNIMSNDVHRFDEFSVTSRSLFVAPLQAAIVTYLLWSHLGWTCLTGMGIIVLFIPFQVLMGRMFRSIRQKTAELTDSRIRLMQEIIAGMRVIKMYAWEQPFALLVATARNLSTIVACNQGRVTIFSGQVQTFLLLEEMSGLDEREGKNNETFISGENEITLGVMENPSSNEEKSVFMDKMSVRWNNV